MLFERRYKPEESEVLYHYCSPETLLAICSYKTIRFCDLYSMNDFMEMHWGYQLWRQVVEEVRGTVDSQVLRDIDQIVSTARLHHLPLASCFSTKGDVLSQWRAYAQDGAGYAIGFSAPKLAGLAVRPLRVSYDLENQKEEIRKTIKSIEIVEQGETATRGEEFFNTCATIAFDLSSFKNPSFSEECEVRLVHLLNIAKSNDSFKLEDAGGHTADGKVTPQKVGFHMTRSTPVPHLDIDFSRGGTEHPVVEVILGPRNATAEMAVSVFLETMGFPNVKASKSTASYR